RDRVHRARPPGPPGDAPRARDQERPDRPLLRHEGRRERRSRRLADPRSRRRLGGRVPRAGGRLHARGAPVADGAAPAAAHPGARTRRHHAVRDLARPFHSQGGVRQPFLLWTSVVALVVAAVALVFGGGTRGTFALFNGETQNQSSTFAGGWVG